MGMGVATPSRRKKKNGKKGKKSKASSSAPFDASASLKRLEKKYEELQQRAAKAIHGDDDEKATSAAELVVAARAVPSKSAATADWVPIAQLCLYPHVTATAAAAVSLHCRELSHAASIGARIFTTVPREQLQYAIEPIDSFHKFVYDAVIQQDGGGSSTTTAGDATEAMTKAEAREVLGVEDDERATVKQAYRKKSFLCHPDRLSSDLTDEERESAAVEYSRIQKANEVLSSGVRTNGSWYASLGGRERTDFQPVELMGITAASSVLEEQGIESAVAALDHEVVQTFVARNQAGSASL